MSVFLNINEIAFSQEKIDIKTIDEDTINNFENLIRKYLSMETFTEIFLPEITPYLVTNTNQIKNSKGEILRNTTEPEIWQNGLKYNNFFCITNLFRKEDETSFLHKEKFRIVDFYLNQTHEKHVLDIYCKMLEFLEFAMKLPKLSRLKMVTCDFNKFSSIKYNNSTERMYKIENYPPQESFYDEIDPKTGNSKKSELFLMTNSGPIEFGVLGQVGDNINPKNRIDDFSFQRLNNKPKDLYGMGIGIERLILCYEYLKKYI